MSYWKPKHQQIFTFTSQTVNVEEYFFFLRSRRDVIDNRNVSNTVTSVVRASSILQQMSFATVVGHKNNSIRCRLKQHNADRAAPL